MFLKAQAPSYNPRLDLLEIDMNNTFLALVIIVVTNFLWTTNSMAASKKFTGIDYSGVYSCMGSNAKVGNYKLVATFLINKSNSHGNIGNYDLTIETENSTTYSGQAITNGKEMALTIEIIDGDNLAYSTGIAHLTPLKHQRYRYTNRYYESNLGSNRSGSDSGNYGSENCIMQK
ncbi:MAG: hypothetical protein ABIU85_10930 [Methylotenera sp.]